DEAALLLLRVSLRPVVWVEVEVGPRQVAAWRSQDDVARLRPHLSLLPWQIHEDMLGAELPGGLSQLGDLVAAPARLLEDQSGHPLAVRAASQLAVGAVPQQGSCVLLLLIGQAIEARDKPSGEGERAFVQVAALQGRPDAGGTLTARRHGGRAPLAPPRGHPPPLR